MLRSCFCNSYCKVQFLLLQKICKIFTFNNNIKLLEFLIASKENNHDYLK